VSFVFKETTSSPGPGSHPGNSHSRASAPCDSRRSACLLLPQAAAGFSPLVVCRGLRELRRGLRGTGAERAQWAMQRGGAWEIARSICKMRLCEFPGRIENPPAPSGPSGARFSCFVNRKYCWYTTYTLRAAIKNPSFPIGKGRMKGSFICDISSRYPAPHPQRSARCPRRAWNTAGERFRSRNRRTPSGSPRACSQSAWCMRSSCAAR